MNEKKLTINVLKATASVMACMMACRFSSGYFIAFMALAAIFFAIQRKMAALIACYLMIPFFNIINRQVIGLSGNLLVCTRFGMLALSVVMILLAGQAKGQHRAPVGGLFVFLLFAFISSIDGWFPMISFLKIANFGLFLLGVMFASKMLQTQPAELRKIRVLMLSFSAIIIVGSVLTRFIPSIGYSMQLTSLEGWGMGMTTREFTSMEGVQLFNGMLYHSQSLAPVVCLFAGWVVCDMILVERRITRLHGLILACVPILLFMSRSRTGLLTFIGLVALVYFFAIPKARLTTQVRSKLFSVFTLLVILLVGAAVVSEFRNDTISKWVRKTENVNEDRRGTMEALTESRMGLVELNMNDFRKNPVFGMGFQVEPWHRAMYQAGIITIYSAPIEKGVLPLMVLGETGIIGGIVFTIFLFSFYGACLRKRYIATTVLFTCMLLTNISEASFFAPSGCGSLAWVIALIGGFTIDLLSILAPNSRPNIGGMVLPEYSVGFRSGNV